MDTAAALFPPRQELVEKPIATVLVVDDTPDNLTLMSALLREHYSATVIATGAPDPAKLGIEGEALRGVHTASDFVGWYNGHPDHRDLEFDFSDRHAVVIGHGNVAADVCRMLLTPVDELAKTVVSQAAVVHGFPSAMVQSEAIARRSIGHQSKRRLRCGICLTPP